MKINKKIAVILRGKNESKWLIQCINSIQKQIYINFDIFYIDNSSSDNSILIASNMGAKTIPYVGDYLPGKMLNYGINFAKQNGDFSHFLFISSHCIVYEKDAFYKLISAINLKKK